MALLNRILKDAMDDGAIEKNTNDSKRKENSNSEQNGFVGKQDEEIEETSFTQVI